LHENVLVLGLRLVLLKVDQRGFLFFLLFLFLLVFLLSLLDVFLSDFEERGLDEFDLLLRELECVRAGIKLSLIGCYTSKEAQSQ